MQACCSVAVVAQWLGVDNGFESYVFKFNAWYMYTSEKSKIFCTSFIYFQVLTCDFLFDSFTFTDSHVVVLFQNQLHMINILIAHMR